MAPALLLGVSRPAGVLLRQHQQRHNNQNVRAAATTRRGPNAPPPPPQQQRNDESAEDAAARSLVETGVRGCLAAAAAYVMHVNPFAVAGGQAQVVADVAASSSSSSSPAAVAALALALATPAIALDLLVLGPDLSDKEKNNNTNHIIVARARRHFARHTAPLATGPAATALPPAMRAALEASAQLSEDALARGVLLAGLAGWMHGRFVEIEPLVRLGVAKALGGGAEGQAIVAAAASASSASSPSTIASDPAWWLAACLLLAGAASRISGAATQARRGAKAKRETRAAELENRLRVLRYEPLAVQERERARLTTGGDGCDYDDGGGGGGGSATDAVVAGEHALVGGRFLLGQAACYSAYILSGGLLWASFVSGLAAQAAHGALVGRRAARDEERAMAAAEAAAAAAALVSAEE